MANSSIESSCLDHLVVIGERHLRLVLAEFADVLNHDRPDRSLRLRTPLPSPLLVKGRVARARLVRSPPRLRAGRLNADRVLPPFNIASGLLLAILFLTVLNAPFWFARRRAVRRSAR